MIVPALRDIQERYGYLPKEELEFLALRAGLGFSTFGANRPIPLVAFDRLKEPDAVIDAHGGGGFRSVARTVSSLADSHAAPPTDTPPWSGESCAEQLAPAGKAP